jgi:hypothetical protein
VGELAREQGALVPGRLVSSAKSWLSHGGVDRTAAILPWGAGDDVRKISPVEASARYLGHVREAWDAEVARGREGHLLADQLVVLTVPASFDEVARELTVAAAHAAGLPRVVLLEEPLAAFYAWLSRHEADWHEGLEAGQLVLVCDVGGGTTDFTIVAVRASERGLRFERLAVGDHLMLGGDNMDLTLARHAEAQFGGKPGQLDAKRWHQLVHQCRGAKELLLAESSDQQRVDVTVMGTGGKLIAGTLKASLDRARVEELLLDGFFPAVAADEPLRGERRAGLTEWGLPYVQDPAITRHLAAFWQRFRPLLQQETGRSELYPDFVLFNGGALTPPLLRERIRQIVGGWFPEAGPPRELESSHPELAVAVGAAYYGMVRLGAGVRVGAGSPRAYYVEVGAAEAGARRAVCLVPRSAEEGFETELHEPAFQARANQPVLFQVLSSATRLGDRLGDVVTLTADEAAPLPPIRTVLRFGKRGEAQELPVRVAVRLTEVGTLDLWCSAVGTPHRWQLSFDVRQDTRPADEVQADPGATLELGLIEPAQQRIRAAFTAGRAEAKPLLEALSGDLAAAVDLKKPRWPTSLIRKLADTLIEVREARKASAEHELRWLNLLGYCMRPGFGDPLDEHRMREVWKLFLQGLVFDKDTQCRLEWWIFWRRVAGGLSAGHQQRMMQDVMPLLAAAERKGKGAVKRLNPQEEIELWMALANLERLSADAKLALGRRLLERVRKGKPAPQELWALSRIGSRIPFYGPLDRTMRADEAAKWAEALLALKGPASEPVAHALVQLARRTGDRARDLPELTRQRVGDYLRLLPKGERYASMLESPESVEEARERDWIFGEALPVGLVLAGGPVEA